MTEEANERLRQFLNDGGNWERKAPDICGICFILEIFRKAIEMGDRTVVSEVVEDK